MLAEVEFKYTMPHSDSDNCAPLSCLLSVVEDGDASSCASSGTTELKLEDFFS